MLTLTAIRFVSPVKSKLPTMNMYYKIDGNLCEISRTSISKLTAYIDNLVHIQIVHVLIVLLSLLCTKPTPTVLLE